MSGKEAGCSVEQVVTMDDEIQAAKQLIETDTMGSSFG